MPRAAAFFDLDRTLIDANSGWLWARHERRHGNITRAQAARAGAWALLYALALIDIERAYEAAIAHYRGVPSDEVDRATRAWFGTDVAHRLRPGGRRALDWHRAEGQPLVLITNSSCYEAAIACETWEMDAWLANVFPTDAQGRLTGTLDRPLCYGPGKVLRAEAWAAANDVDLDQSWFYTDSISDLAMLERVGHPVIIAPDPKLRREARRRAWPIEGW